MVVIDFNTVVSFTDLNPTPNSVFYRALDELIPSSIDGKSGEALLTALKTNNLANKILNVYYRIKRNVEYISEGKESLYSVSPNYSTKYPRASLNARHSRQYFNLIAHYPNQSFGKVVNLAAHILQNNKQRSEQNTKGLQGYKLL